MTTPTHIPFYFLAYNTSLKSICVARKLCDQLWLHLWLTSMPETLTWLTFSWL